MFWSIHRRCIKEKNYQKFFFGEDSAYIHESQQTASTDNTLLYLHNSSYDTQPHSLIVNYSMGARWIWGGK